MDDIDRHEKEWYDKFHKMFPLKDDRNKITTYCSRCFYKPHLVEWREKLRRKIAMRAMRNRHTKYYLMGTVLQLAMAIELLKRKMERHRLQMRTVFSTYGSGLHTAELMTAVEVESVTIDDFVTYIDKIIIHFGLLMGVTKNTIQEYITNKPIADEVWDYSVAYRAAHRKDESRAVRQIIDNENKTP